MWVFPARRLVFLARRLVFLEKLGPLLVQSPGAKRLETFAVAIDESFLLDKRI